MPAEVSVVVPTFNRARFLDGLLSSLASQRQPGPIEVIVADDGSTDDTPATVERWRDALDLTSLRLDHGGPAAARNRGLERAAGQIVLFVDDDERADPGLVAAHRAAHDAHPADDAGIVGSVDWAPEVRRTRFLRWLDESGLQFAYAVMEPGRVPHAHGAFYTANLSIKTSFLRTHGLRFDERFPYAAFEDSLLGWQAEQLGFELHYHPEARVEHVRQVDPRSFAIRMEHVGESAAILSLVAPDFPLDESFFQRGPGPSKGMLLRLAAPFVGLLGPDRLAFRLHDHMAARAYRRGRRAAAKHSLVEA